MLKVLCTLGGHFGDGILGARHAAVEAGAVSRFQGTEEEADDLVQVAGNDARRGRRGC